MGPPNAELSRSSLGTRLRFRMLAVLCGAMMLFSGYVRGEASAAEWSAEPSLSVKGEYNSNLLMYSGNNEVFGYWVSPGLKFHGATEAFEVDGSVKSDFVQYYGAENRSFTNLYFPLRTSYRWSRSTFGFEGGFTRDNTLMGELKQTGLVIAFTQRNLWTAIPTWTLGITEQLNWQVGYQFVNATYDDGLKFGLVDYQLQGGTSALTYQFNERDQVQLTGEYTNFKTPAIQQQVSYSGVGASVSHVFSDTMTATVSGGPRFVSSTQDYPGGSATLHNTVWTFNARIKKDFERASVMLEGARDINPSGFGFMLQTDRIGVTLTHNLTETVTFSMNGGLYFVSPLTSAALSTPFPQQNYGVVTPRVSWKIGQWWSMDVSYTYAERVVGSYDERYFANSTFVMLTYGGEKWSVSR